MVIQEFTFQLKDGRTALVRSPREDDIQGMLEYLAISAGETEYILRYPEECTRYTAEKEKALFEKVNASPHCAFLVCVVDGIIAGNCQIEWSELLKIRHRASVAIALLREYWNLGIGTRLFEEMIRIAEENKDILQMELDYVEGNSRARSLYEKMGFRTVGIKPNAIRLKNGTLLNEYLMVRKMERCEL